MLCRRFGVGGSGKGPPIPKRVRRGSEYAVPGAVHPKSARPLQTLTGMPFYAILKAVHPKPAGPLQTLKGIALYAARPPGPRTKVFLFGFRAAPQLGGPAGLGCTAPGTSYKGISIRVVRGPAAAWPAYKAMSFRVWSGPAGLGCTAPGTAYKGIPFRVSRGPAARRSRRFRVHDPWDCVQRYFV